MQPSGNEPPHAPSARWSDHDVEQVIGRLLQIGVLVAAAVAIVGGIALLVRHGAETANFRSFRGTAEPLRSLAAIGRGTLAGDPRAIVQLGLVLLIATPVARVALTLGAFIIQRDRLYVAITSVVLALLLWGLL